MRAAIVDLDGTVYRGGTPVEGAAAGVRALREAGLEVVFLTNNPTRRPSVLAGELRDVGIPADAGDVLTSTAATRAYLEDRHAGAAVFPVAGEGVVDQLRDADVALVEEPTAADVVVAGYDEGFDFRALTGGLRALRAGAVLVGTDPDRWVPTDGGPVPGSGAIVNAVAGAAEVEPEAVLGKPSRETAERALDRLDVPPGECLLVGDRLDTDVAMGERAGMTTVLVGTGAADEAALADAEVTPDHVLDSLADVDAVL